MRKIIRRNKMQQIVIILGQQALPEGESVLFSPIGSEEIDLLVPLDETKINRPLLDKMIMD